MEAHALVRPRPDRLAGRTRAPVERITETARSISGARLDRRARSRRPGKVLPWLLGFVALAVLACCGSVGFIVMQSNKKQQEAPSRAGR